MTDSKLHRGIAVIGAGLSGLFTTLYLANAGYSVSLFDRGLPGSGTSGKFHGLLHSGARYAVTDRQAAIECISESGQLRRMAPHLIEETGGLFISLSDGDEEYASLLTDALADCSIPFEQLTAREAIEREPMISKEIRSGLLVPDGVIRGTEFLMSLALECLDRGAEFRPFRRLVSSHQVGGRVEDLIFIDERTGRREMYNPEVVVNTSGPWSSEISELLGSSMGLSLSRGTMAVFRGRCSLSILEHMRPPSDGDIIVPYGFNSIAGTTSSSVSDPDKTGLKQDDISLLRREAALLVPSLSGSVILRTYASVRPLLKVSNDGSDGRKLTRDFYIHTPDSTGITNLFAASGGKATTSRLIGEKLSSAVSLHLDGVRINHQDIRITDFSRKFDAIMKRPQRETAMMSLFSASSSMDSELFTPAFLTMLVSLLATTGTDASED